MVINPKGTDGVFGPGCESAVSRYQSKKGLSSTGIVDIDTWEKLRADITPIQIALKNKGYIFQHVMVSLQRILQRSAQIPD